MTQQHLSLDAQSRTTLGKKVSTLRQDGVIPAILYGHGVKNTTLSVPSKIFEKIYEEAGESTLIDLTVDGKNSRKVLIQDIQRDYLKGGIIHIDFHEVKMTEKLTAEIPFKFVGESKAVKELGGVMVVSLDHLRVQCLPGDLVHEIEVDISALVDFETIIHVNDLKISKGIEILDKADEVVVTVAKSRVEEEAAAVPAEGEQAKVAEVEVVEKKKKEEVAEE